MTVRRQFAAVEAKGATHYAHVIAIDEAKVHVDLTQTRDGLYVAAPLTPDQARELARGLLAAADACDSIARSGFTSTAAALLQPITA